MLNDLLSFNFGSVGTSSVAAFAASSPKLNFFPLALCNTIPFSATHSSFATFHVCAAAAINISRAVAPILRNAANRLLIAPLPPATCDPNVLSNGAGSTFIFFQSTPNSSATINGKDVFTPCPISGFGAISTIDPSLPILMYAFGENTGGSFISAS